MLRLHCPTDLCCSKTHSTSTSVEQHVLTCTYNVMGRTHPHVQRGGWGTQRLHGCIAPAIPVQQGTHGG